MDIGLFLSKLLPVFVYPAGLTCTLLVLALVLSLFGKRVLSFICVLSGLLVLALGASPRISQHLFYSLEKQFPPAAIDSLPRADAIVYLGGGLSAARPPRLTADLISSSDRLLHTARLFRKGLAPVVVVSGGDVWPQSASRPEALDVADLLVEWGVERAAIEVEPGSRTTYENAINTRKILQDAKLRRVLLVTSAAHMRRALATFRSAGIDAWPAPTDYEASVADNPLLLDLLPNSEDLYRTRRAIKEYLGFKIYQFRGWITDEGLRPPTWPG